MTHPNLQPARIPYHEHPLEPGNDRLDIPLTIGELVTAAAASELTDDELEHVALVISDAADAGLSTALLWETIYQTRLASQ